ncbi:ABC transporter permease [Bariatricus sp. SGI.154]|uniref:ABC transporter permease n=1 Tax=Bariatricus sp. SGI.154 TaxID=3420549 RepID=UPI003D07A2FF
MSTYIQNFLRFRPLLNELVARDVKIKYRRSVLGVLWTLLNPLMMMIVLSVVYSNLFKFDVENFSIYLLSGQVIFNFYSDATNTSMSSILGSASLIKKVYIPKYLFVMSRICSSVINLLASFSTLILVMLATRVELHYTIFLVFVPIVLLVVFSFGIGLFLAAITVKFRDVMHLYSVFVTALMYLTPVIYPMSILPNWLTIIVKANPLTNYLTMFRDVMMNNRIFDVQSLFFGILEAIVALFFGLYVFYRNQDTFILNL